MRLSKQHVPGIMVGSFTVAFLSDGIWLNDGGCMFGVVPRELWRTNHPPDDYNRIRLNLTCPLITKGSEAILIDTGIGNRLSEVERKIFSHGEGMLPEGLRALGMEAGDVTSVILSHLHFDHFGGVVRSTAGGRLIPAFPRARYFIQRGEFELVRTTKNERLRAAYRHANSCLEPIASQIEVIEGDTEITAGLRAVVTGGHTWDHQIALLNDGGQHFAHLADIVPTRSHMRGPWNQAYDLDVLTTMAQKARYLELAVAEQWWISFAHDDRVFSAHVGNEGGKLALRDAIEVPAEIASNG